MYSVVLYMKFRGMSIYDLTMYLITTIPLPPRASEGVFDGTYTPPPPPPPVPWTPA